MLREVIMFLSSVQLPSGQPPNPYKIHQQLWHNFPDDPDGERPFLFQMEDPQRLLLLSSREPMPQSGGARIIGTKPYTPQPQAGQMLRFRLDANPTKRLKKERNRVPLIHEEEQISWLSRKLQGAATVSEVLISRRENLFFRKGRRAGKIVKVRFEGILTVNYPEQLINMVEKGVGPAKAFGCGLLLVRRLS